MWPWVTRYVHGPVARLLLGVRTYGTSPTGGEEGYRATTYRRVVAASGALDGVDLGTVAPVVPAVGFGFSEPPRRPSMVATRPLLRYA